MPHVQKPTMEENRKRKEETPKQNKLVQEKQQQQKVQICVIRPSNTQITTSKIISKGYKQT